MRLALAVAVALAAAAPLADGRLVADGVPVDFAALVARARGARVVYVGEQHGTVEHHRLQAELLQAMHGLGPVVLGCEYFPRSLQPVLDRFHRGEVSLAELPRALDWETTWGHPWAAYAPIFERCAELRIPIAALNAEKALVTRVRREGLRALSVEELLRLPRMELDVPAHRERAARLLQEAHPLPPPALERYYEAFTLWDEAMAEGVVEAALKDGREGVRVLVVAGIAHVQQGTGIPDRVSRRWPAPRLIVACGDVEPGDGDVLFLPPPVEEERRWY